MTPQPNIRYATLGDGRESARLRWTGPTIRAPWAALAVAAFLAACGGGAGTSDDAEASVVVTDSTGIRVVTNLESTPAGWVAGDELLSIGWGEDGPFFQWTQAGRLLDDGGILIGDTQEAVIYRIGAGGDVLDRWGRRGEGPAEYQRFDALVLQGDTIVVHDSRNVRVTRLSPRGEVLGTHSAHGIRRLEASSMLPDGRLLFVPSETFGGPAQQRPEWIFETRPILAMDLRSQVLDTLAQLPAMRMWHGGPRGAVPGVAPILGGAGGTPDGFAWARADRTEVLWFDERGDVRQIARWAEPPKQVSPQWREYAAAVVEEGLRERGVEEARIAESLAQLEEGLDQHEGPLPYWDELRVDREGNVWLRQHAPGPSRSNEWRVISNEGVDLGIVEIPDAIAVLDIASDRALVARLDELDVNGVVVVGLTKPE